MGQDMTKVTIDDYGKLRTRKSTLDDLERSLPTLLHNNVFFWNPPRKYE